MSGRRKSRVGLQCVTSPKPTHEDTTERKEQKRVCVVCSWVSRNWYHLSQRYRSTSDMLLADVFFVPWSWSLNLVAQIKEICIHFYASHAIDADQLFLRSVQGLRESDLTIFGEWWLHFLRIVPNSCAVILLCLFGTFCCSFLASWMYAWIDFVQPSCLERFKIQKGTSKVVTYKQVWKCLRLYLFNQFIVSMILSVLSLPSLFHQGIVVDFQFPSWWELILRIFIYFIIEDTWTYWIHRLFHTSWAYRHIHSIHHEFDYSISWVTLYKHPVEYTMEAMGTSLGPSLLGNDHILTICLWIFLRQLEGVEVHCGYDFPFQLNHFLPFYAGSLHHDFHHSFCHANYSSVFIWWDRLCGTDSAYEDWKRRGGYSDLEKRMKKKE